MAVRIRLKKMGRKHRPFYRVCAMDSRAPRDGRVIEQLGIYDTSVPDSDARAVLNAERIKYWLSVGAKPTPKVGTLIKKYGPEGTHLEAQTAALAKLSTRRATSIEAARDAASKVEMPKAVPEAEKPAEGEAAAEATEEAKTDAPAEAKADAPAEEKKAEAKPEAKPEAKAEEPKAEEAKAEAPAAEAKPEAAPAEEKKAE